MKVKINVELNGFAVPDYVYVRRNEIRPADDRKIYLSELTPEILEKLCDEFKRDVFKKAGKRMPETAVLLDCRGEV